MRLVHFSLIGMMALAMAPSGLNAKQKNAAPADVRAVQTNASINVDGVADETAWAKAKPFVTYDPQAKVNLTIKVLYTKDSIYVLAHFPDKTESRTHKTQTWDETQKRYRIGFDREDSFVLKWSMEPRAVDLRVDADEPYKADIWFWKAHRTDRAGYADDKMHIYSSVKTPNSKQVASKQGLRFYLSRPGDAGRSAYKTVLHPKKKGEREALFASRKPEGSRADVRAKGVWRDGHWTIEFARKLKTGHRDDVQFDAKTPVSFGVAKYEIAGRPYNPKLDQPYFGAGEITQLLRLTFD